MLPLEMVYLVGSFLPWRDRIQTITKSWLLYFLQRKRRVTRWKSKRLLYSYMNIGLRRPWLTWKKFAIRQCQLKRRKRNHQHELSWKAAVAHYMVSNRCQSCGQTTKSNVFGTHLCTRCRSSPGKIHTYMITTGQALALGLRKTELETIPFHRGNMGSKLRFKRDVLAVLGSLAHISTTPCGARTRCSNRQH